METSSLIARWNLSSLQYETDVKKFKNQKDMVKEKLLEIEKEYSPSEMLIFITKKT